ncbi:glycine cleavage system protein H [uncultured Draconibacterium sp.]|uniref:glycine cleavage system protein H n=1 Tax=uncultured Draconibacterium sp. TaxID=1573823 RepID=UPI0029C94362|nr:glycine cleavage system protein H [uncultured Draconibacterium sp.]
MEGFTYSNLFDTKGIEYIVVIIFLLLLIPFWVMVNRKSEVVQHIQQGIRVLTTNFLRIPKGLFFSPNHTWTYLEKSGQAKIGLDDFLQNVLGEIAIQPLKSTGDTVKKGEVLALIEQGGKQLRVHSPLSGKIVAANFTPGETDDSGSKELEAGWLYSIVPASWQKETSGFLLGAEAANWFTDEITRLKDFLNINLARQAGVSTVLAYQEGGELEANPLASLDAGIWDEFQNEFMEQQS